MNRGTGRGRGGGSYNNMGGRGGGNQGGSSFRGQGSSRGFGNRDNRRGGSFNNQSYSHSQQHQPYQQQQNYHNNNHHQNQSHSSFRGRGGYNHSNRGGRHDSASASGRDNISTASGSFSSGKRDENKRTLTDFKIVGLKIPHLDWHWGTLPEAVAPTVKGEAAATPIPSDAPPAVQPSDGTSTAHAEGASTGSDVATTVPPAPAVDASSVKAEIEALLPPPPSRVRMYFHTPVSPDDAHPISQSSYGSGSSVSNARKGKRKKLDDDGDYEEGRGAPPPPPHGSGLDAGGDYEGIGRDSVAPSVAETTSEGDWLMAAIGEEDGDGAENLHVSEVENFLDGGEAGDGDYGKRPSITETAHVWMRPSTRPRSHH